MLEFCERMRVRVRVRGGERPSGNEGRARKSAGRRVQIDLVTIFRIQVGCSALGWHEQETLDAQVHQGCTAVLA